MEFCVLQLTNPMTGVRGEQTESELCRLCDCTIFGADALKAVDAGRELGFRLTRKENLSIARLAEVLQAGLYPILYVNLWPIDGEVGGRSPLKISPAWPT